VGGVLLPFGSAFFDNFILCSPPSFFFLRRISFVFGLCRTRSTVAGTCSKLAFHHRNVPLPGGGGFQPCCLFVYSFYSDYCFNRSGLFGFCTRELNAQTPKWCLRSSGGLGPSPFCYGPISLGPRASGRTALPYSFPSWSFRPSQRLPQRPLFSRPAAACIGLESVFFYLTHTIP